MKKHKGVVFFPLLMVLVILMFLMISMILYFSSSYRIARKLEDRLVLAVIDVATDNWANIYSSLREGYSGAYSYNLASFSESVSYPNNKKRILSYLNTDDNGIKKNEDGKLVFRIYNIQSNIKNVAFKNNTLSFKVHIRANLDIPSYHDGKTSYIKLILDKSAGYSKIF